MNEAKQMFFASVFVTLLALTGLAWSEPSVESNSKLPSNLQTEYQAAISKAFPGYQILNPSEILLNKKVMGAKLYNKVKSNPSLIVGKFNDDDIEDFAALIRKSTIKTNVGTMDGKVIVKYDFYDSLLVVCYGLGEGTFDCSKIPRLFREAHLPISFALNNTGPGKYSCSLLKSLNMDNDDEPYDIAYGEKRNIHLYARTDVISFFKTTYSAGGDMKFIYQPETDLMECLESSD